MTFGLQNQITLATLTFFFMEPVMYMIHKYLMHGVGWSLHVVHHTKDSIEFNDNDYFNVGISFFFTGLWLVAFLGFFNYEVSCAIVWGGTVYGLVAGFIHEEVIHGRFGLGNWTWLYKYKYIKRLVKAHHMHHRVKSKDGAIALGFMYAPPKFDKPETVDFNVEETMFTYYGPLFGLC